MIILSGGIIVNEKFIKLVQIKEDKWGELPQSELYVDGYKGYFLISKKQAEEILKKFEKSIDK